MAEPTDKDRERTKRILHQGDVNGTGCAACLLAECRVQDERAAITRTLDTIERALLAPAGNDCKRRYLAVSRAIADERARIAGVEEVPESAPVSVLRVLEEMEKKAAELVEASRKPSQWPPFDTTVVSAEARAVFEFVRDEAARVRAEGGA